MTDSEKLDAASIELKSHLLSIVPTVINDTQPIVYTEDSLGTHLNNNNTETVNTNILTETITSEHSVRDTPVDIYTKHLNLFENDDVEVVADDDMDKAAKEIINTENEVLNHPADTDIPIPNTHKRKTFKWLKKMLIRPFLACLGLKK